MQKTRRTDSLMSLREIQPCACMMRTWRWHNLMLSREFWPLRRELVTCIRAESMAYAQCQSVKLLVGPFGSSNPSVVLDQLLHRLNECHAHNRPFVLTTLWETRGLESSPQFSNLTQSERILATGGTLVGVQGRIAHHNSDA